MSQQNEERETHQDGHENDASRSENSNDSTEYRLQTFTTSTGSYMSSSDANQDNYIIHEPLSSQNTDSSYHQAQYDDETSDESDYDESLDYVRVRKINDVESDVIYKCGMDWGKRENEFNDGDW